MKYLNIKDIEEDTQVSRKQINNRIKKVIHHDRLVIGGGKGRGGKYQIHPLLKNYLTAPTYFAKFKEILNPNGLFNNFDAFGLIDWRWFSCYSPKECFELDKLIANIHMNDGDIVYYSIHSRKSTNDFHIHYSSTSEVNPIVENSISHISLPFDASLGMSCFHYFNKPSENQLLIEVGFLLGVKHHHSFKRIRLY
jgi:hypothetical protein